MAQEKFVEIRCDDVLLLGNLTGSMKNSLRYGTFFEHFKRFDKILEDNHLHCILTIMAEGIPYYPEWVKYIKERQFRYTIQLHGFSHYYYKGLSEEDAYRSLLAARWMVEQAFGTTVTRWYVPFGRHYFPEWSLRVCERLGLKFHTRGGTTRHFYFHYWNSRDRNRLGRLIKEHGPKIIKYVERAATN